jgi:hypothetical protein
LNWARVLHQCVPSEECGNFIERVEGPQDKSCNGWGGRVTVCQGVSEQNTLAVQTLSKECTVASKGIDWNC